MTKQQANPADASRIECSVRMTLAEATPLKERLLAAAGAESDPCIDASGVEQIDASCLQLFAAFARDRRSAGRGVDWNEPSEAFLESAELLGLVSELGLPGHVSDRSAAKNEEGCG